MIIIEKELQSIERRFNWPPEPKATGSNPVGRTIANNPHIPYNLMIPYTAVQKRIEITYQVS